MGQDGSDVRHIVEELPPELFKTHIGGQALIEGIMMRGKHNWAVAVRKPDGTIHSEEYELEKTPEGSPKKWPIFRGWFALVGSFKLGMKALDISTLHAYPEEAAEQESSGSGMGTKLAQIAGIVLGVVVALVVFNIFPSWLANVAVGDYSSAPLAWNTVQNILQLILFVIYVLLIMRMKEIQRMFAYHGAEHKTIHAFEHGMDLTPENAAKFPREHVRCGTAFIVMTTILSILIFTVLPLDRLLDGSGIEDPNARLALVIAMRLALIPLVTGLTYEFTVVWAGRNPDNPLVRALIWPGVAMQRLTTKEPDEGMLEVAIEATKLVIAREEREKEKVEAPSRPLVNQTAEGMAATPSPAQASAKHSA